MQDQADTILRFWFGALNEDGWVAEDRFQLWFGACSATDEDIRARFSTLIESAICGDLAHWANNSDACNMALILLTDQMTRAVYRGSACAFEGDPIALSICKEGIADGRHQRIPPAWRVFYYLPLEHSEVLEDQCQSVALFHALQQEYPNIDLESTMQYAIQHHGIIERFGRFPHRNVLLGRSNTVAEQCYLTENPDQFGQQGKT